MNFLTRKAYMVYGFAGWNLKDGGKSCFVILIAIVVQDFPHCRLFIEGETLLGAHLLPTIAAACMLTSWMEIFNPFYISFSFCRHFQLIYAGSDLQGVFHKTQNTVIYPIQLMTLDPTACIPLYLSVWGRVIQLPRRARTTLVFYSRHLRVNETVCDYFPFILFKGTLQTFYFFNISRSWS